jgi:hypothetical protein
MAATYFENIGGWDVDLQAGYGVQASLTRTEAGRRGSREACPACHEKPDYGRRPVDGICRDCAIAIARARAAKEEQQERQNQGGKVAVWFPWAAHALPHLSHDKGSTFDARDSTRDRFFALALAVSEPAGEGNTDRTLVDYKPRAFDNSPSRGKVRVLAPMVADALRALYQSILELSENAHAEGERRGRRLLFGLATGDVSVNDFNKATIDADLAGISPANKE